jgi:hypothetical protein
MAFTTRIVVDTIAPAPDSITDPEAFGSTTLAVMSQLMSGSPSMRIR